MDKLTKFEVKILTYLDKKLGGRVDKGEVFKILKDEFGLDKSEVLDLYRLWYYNKGTGDYESIEVDREGPLLNFINNISLLSGRDISDYIDTLYDEDREKLDGLIGDWFSLCDTRNTPCLDFEDGYLSLSLDRDEWEKYFSGLHEDDLWKYYEAFSSYSDYYEEIENTEFDYVYTNEETVKHLETLAILSGLSQWPGKDGARIEEEEVNNFLSEILPKEYYERVVDDYIGEMSIAVTRARQNGVRETYSNEIKYNTNKSSCRYGNYCIEIPYDDLKDIIKEKDLLNLSELKDAEIQPEVDLEDAYYGTWLDDEGHQDVINELNRSLEGVIDKIVDDEDLDLEELIENRKKIIELLSKLGFKEFAKTSQGSHYIAKNGIIQLHSDDIDFKNNKVKFMYDGAYHMVPIEDLSNWVYGSVLDLNESVRFNKTKKLLKEEKENVTKISIFDFDGTLMNTPHPEEGKKQWEEFTGEKYPHVGWWSKPESLDDAVFDIQPIQSTVSDYKKEINDPNTLVIMLTGRLPHQAEQIEELLSLHNIYFDEYHYKGNGDTLNSKLNTIQSLLNRFPSVNEIEMWEDREPHAIEFDRWGKEKGIDLYVNLVNSTNELINESVNDNLIDKVISSLKPPYIYNLYSMGFNSNDSEKILSKIFGEGVHIYDDSVWDSSTNSVSEPKESRVQSNETDNVLYIEYFNGDVIDWIDWSN